MISVSLSWKSIFCPKAIKVNSLCWPAFLIFSKLWTADVLWKTTSWICEKSTHFGYQHLFKIKASGPSFNDLFERFSPRHYIDSTYDLNLRENFLGCCYYSKFHQDMAYFKSRQNTSISRLESLKSPLAPFRLGKVFHHDFHIIFVSSRIYLLFP